MQYAFQDFENVYIVLDLLNGGDLRYHVSRYRKFSEEQTKFFMACILLSLEYIHNNKILHRDLKPENLVLDDQGRLNF
jgi:serine/threonine protein kinase